MEIPAIITFDGETASHHDSGSIRSTGSGMKGGYVHSNNHGYGCPNAARHRWNGWNYFEYELARAHLPIGIGKEHSNWE